MHDLPTAGSTGARPSAPFRASSTDNSKLPSPRRRRRTGWAALALVSLLGACEAIPTGTMDSASLSASGEQEFVSLVNEHRASIGCPSLAWDGRVADVALRHSQDMASRHFFGHTNPDGVDPFARLRAAGIAYSTAGENIAEGQDSAREVFRAWMNSAPHRRNIENCAFTRHGMGMYQGRWTHMFVRP